MYYRQLARAVARQWRRINMSVVLRLEWPELRIGWMQVVYVDMQQWAHRSGTQSCASWRAQRRLVFALRVSPAVDIFLGHLFSLNYSLIVYCDKNDWMCWDTFLLSHTGTNQAQSHNWIHERCCAPGLFFICRFVFAAPSACDALVDA